MKKVLACLGAATLASGKVYFSETFDDDWEDRWVNSQWEKKQETDTSLVHGRKGNFTLTAGKFFKDEQEDRGIQTEWVRYPDRGYFWDISAAFESFSNAGKELIVQYQVKYEKGVECGGGYIKLGPKMDQTNFGEPTPFNILFGPDKCGHLRSTRRTRLEFNYKGKVVSKKRPMVYRHGMAKDNQEEPEVRAGGWDGISHLYRLILRPNNTVRVEIDMKKIYEGSIRDEWEGFKIGHPDEHKPADWADDQIIDDPDDKMPDDFAQKRMVDPAAEKPHDWDAEEDGEWEPPMINNPAFKGKWVVKRIYNKAYDGHWQAQQIDNPEYADDKVGPYKFDDFSYVGFDLWQQRGGAIFDNIIICNDVAEAAPFEAQWQERVRHEKAAKIAEEEKKKRDEEEAKKKEEARVAHEAAVKAEKVANREKDRKMGYDNAKLDRLERGRARAKENAEYEANQLARKREEEIDQKMMGDEVGKIQRMRNRKAAGRHESAFHRQRADQEKKDDKQEAESGGILIPPGEEDPKEKEKEELEAKKEAVLTDKAIGEAGKSDEKMASRAHARARREVAEKDAAEKVETIRAGIAASRAAMAEKESARAEL